MRIPKPPRYQLIGFLVSMPFITLALCYIMYDEQLFRQFDIWLVAYPVIYAIGYVSWRLHYVYDHYLHNRFPSLKQTRKRVMYTFAVNFLVMTPSVLLILFTFNWFHIFGYMLEIDDLKYGYLVGLGVNIIFESLWEVIYIIEKFKEVAAEKEMIEQMHLQQEFDNLKQKVNPHFLFNSFNTLSSLISEDKDRAEKFLDELSKVYRYLLRNNESGMSTVEEELKFIRSYSTLLQTRYGEGFKIDLMIDPALKDKAIPSLSLQLLVENAVKHNIVSKQQPVHVIIRSTSDGYLTVENNLRKKTRIAVESTGIGLSNIREKYRLLQRNDVTIEETENQFKVTIPLIA
ncbi:MAG: histidine kinase [Saprospiraceae bacterium]|uniref:Histidine kinase n=1 Tax=Candidatus Opimibacter skivensis TaxID=2982028 RepID=A0A9D7XSK0_9BACT|nr:histidine kinase [Candidatus Opimibacter skivensis]